MQAAQDGVRDDRCAHDRAGDQCRVMGGRRPALANPLVWPCLVEEVAVLVEHLLQVHLVHHKHMVEALTPERSDESLLLSDNYSSRMNDN